MVNKVKESPPKKELIGQWNNKRILAEGIELAFFIFPIKELALHVVKEALNLARIKNNEKRAHRRRWFTKGKYQDGGGPTRTLFHENQMVQFFIYHEIEKFEIAHENFIVQGDLPDLITGQHSSIDPSVWSQLAKYPIYIEDLITRYLKAIMLYANNNTEDLLVAIFCLVCNLQPKDASFIHSLFKPVSPNYCSKRKHIIMKKLLKRFTNYLQINNIDGKTSYFEGQNKIDTRRSRLVEELFSLAKPWGSTCPEGKEIHFSDRLNSWLNNFYYKFLPHYGTVNDHCEIAHLHAILCPTCFFQLMKEANYHCPRAYLALPEFHNLIEPPQGQTSLMSIKERKIRLNEDELDLVYKDSIAFLSDQQRRRENIYIEKIAVICDTEKVLLNIANEQREILDFSLAKSAKVKIDAEVSCLKIISWDDNGELPIAVLMLDQDSITKSLQYKLYGYLTKTLYLNNTQSLICKIQCPDTSFNSEYTISLEYKQYNSSLLNDYFPSVLQNNYARIGILLIITILSIVAILPLFKPQTDLVSINSPIETPRHRGSNRKNYRGNPFYRSPADIKLVAPQKSENINLQQQFYPIQNNGGSIDISTWQIKANTDLINLKLTIPPNTKKHAYYLLIRSEKLSNTIWRSPALTLEANNTSFNIDLQASLFDKGEYKLILQTNDNDKLIDTYYCPIKIEILDN